MPLGPMKTKAQKQAGMHEVMGEFKRGKLRSGSKTGPKVTNRKQAIAIGLSQTGQSRYADGGIVEHHDDPDLPPLQDNARLEQQIHYPPEYLQTMDLLQKQADENLGEGYQPSNFFLSTAIASGPAPASYSLSHSHAAPAVGAEDAARRYRGAVRPLNPPLRQDRRSPPG